MSSTRSARSRNTVARVTSIVASTTVLLLVAAAPASADVSYAPSGVFGQTQGSSDGEVSDPQRVAVESSTGNILVADRGNSRVQVFAPDGAGSATYLTQFGSGVVDGPLGIAIDQATGDVYVSDTDDIVKFSSDRQATPTFTLDLTFSSPGVTGPLGYDQDDDQLLVADTAANVVRRYAPDGSVGSTLNGSGSGSAFTQLKDITVQDDGDVVVIDGSRVLRFTSDNSYAATVTGLPGVPDVVAAVPGGDDVVLGHPGGYNEDFTVLSPADVYRVSGDTYHGTTEAGDAVLGFRGLAVSGGAGGQLYAVTAAEWWGGAPGISAYSPFSVQAPAVGGLDVIASQTGARLSGSITPNRDLTAWYFEYGTTTAYGKRYPRTDASLPAGSDPVAVARTIGGLTPNTTYHFRIVAANGGGATESADRSFTTPAASPPAGAVSGRAYEQVTPVEKNGVIPYVRFPVLLPAEGGDTVAYAVAGAFPGDPTSVLEGYEVSRRGADGWTTTSAEVPQSQPDAGNTFAWTALAFSRDLRRSLTVSNRALAPGAIEGGSNIYIKDTLTGEISLSFASPLARLRTDVNNIAKRPDFFGASADLSHFAFSTFAQVLPDAAPGRFNAYELGGSQLRVVGKVGGVAPVDGSGLVVVGYETPFGRVSADGRRTFFSTGSALQQAASIYVSTDGGEPVPIIVSRRTGEIGELKPGFFSGASRDGSIVYFRTVDPLTDVNTTDNFYRYDIDTDELTDIGAQIATDGSLGYSSTADISQDGATVVFTVQGGHAGLYVSTGNETKQIGIGNGSENADAMLPHLSSNGRFIAFQSSLNQTGDQTDGTSQVYVYDRELDELRCASCSPQGSGGSYMVNARRFFAWQELAMLDDGRLFYESDKGLVGADTNGRRDVYAWDWETGTNRLISPGTADVNARFTSASTDGRSVFFMTAQRLVAQDQDDLDDLYVARVGGGLAAQNEVVAQAGSCTGDDCQGPPTANSMSRPGGASSAGKHDPPPKLRAAFSGGLPTAKQRAALAGGKTVILKTTINQPGKVTILVKARVGGKKTAILSASKTATKAGIVSMSMKLSSAGLRALRSARSLRVTFSARVTGVAAARTNTATLRAPKPSTSTPR